MARGHLDADDHLYRGLVDGAPAATFPLPITADVMARGRERYDIYCAPCHDVAGTGRGSVVQRGMLPPPTFHDDRLRAMPLGEFYGVITDGVRNMPGYAAQIPVNDRWAIAAYVRALQRSRNATLEDIPAAERANVPPEPPPPPAAEAAPTSEPATSNETPGNQDG